LVRESQFFADMFTLPILEPSKKVEGLTDDKPIMLPANITAASFRHLLKALYYPTYASISLYTSYKFLIK